MPTVRDAIVKGPLSQPERKVLEAIGRPYGNIFSTSLEDLAELACRCMTPGNSQPPELVEVPTGLTLNSSMEVWIDHGRHKDKTKESTYSLRTIKKALSSLAKTNRIWRGKLYFASGDAEDPASGKQSETGRIYYGAHGIHYSIENELTQLNPKDRAIARYETLSTAFVEDDDTPES